MRIKELLTFGSERYSSMIDTDRLIPPIRGVANL